jgi:hypothetical protein
MRPGTGFSAGRSVDATMIALAVGTAAVVLASVMAFLTADPAPTTPNPPASTPSITEKSNPGSTTKAPTGRDHINEPVDRGNR